MKSCVFFIAPNSDYTSESKLGLFGLQYRKGKLRVVVPITVIKIKDTVARETITLYKIGEATLGKLRLEHTKQGRELLHADYTEEFGNRVIIKPITIIGKNVEFIASAGREIVWERSSDGRYFKRETGKLILGGDWIDLTPYIPIQKAP